MAVGGVICCGRWAAGLAGCGVGRCWRWAAGCCEVWQGVQAVQLCGLRGHRCGAGGAGPSRCRWLAQYPGTASSAPRVLSSFSPGRPPTTPSACRAADPAGRAGGKAAQKKKARADGAACAAALVFCLHWWCDPLRRVRPGAGGGRCTRVFCPLYPGRPGCTGSGRNGSGWQRSSVARPALAVLHPGQFCRLPEGSDPPPNGIERQV